MTSFPLTAVRCYIVDGNKTLVVYNAESQQWVCENDLSQGLALSVQNGTLILGATFAPQQPEHYEFDPANNECVFLQSGIVVGTGDIRNVTSHPTDFRFFDLAVAAVKLEYNGSTLRVTYDAHIPGSVFTSPYSSSGPC